MTEPTPEPGRDLVPIPKPEPPPAPAPGVVDLVTRSARVGLDAAGLAAGEVAGASVRFARAVLPPALASRPLDAVGQEVNRRLAAARLRDETRRDEAREAVQAVVRQATESVLDTVDLTWTVEAVLERMDLDGIIETVLARIDTGAILQEVDVGSMMRDSTSTLAGEALDGFRGAVMGLDVWTARWVDKILRRKRARNLIVPGYDVFAPEIPTSTAVTP
jgi:hypothetical protein